MPMAKVFTPTESMNALPGRISPSNANNNNNHNTVRLPSIHTLMNQPAPPISRQELERRLKPSVQRLLRDAAKSHSLNGQSPPLTPRMDLYMSPEGATAMLELAGLSREQVHINVSNRVLTVSAIRHRPQPLRAQAQQQPAAAPAAAPSPPPLPVPAPGGERTSASPPLPPMRVSPTPAPSPTPAGVPNTVPVGLVVHERRHGHISRAIRLPGWVRAEDIRARMENGVLTITFPRSKEEHVDAHAMVIDVL